MLLSFVCDFICSYAAVFECNKWHSCRRLAKPLMPDSSWPSHRPTVTLHCHEWSSGLHTHSKVINLVPLYTASRLASTHCTMTVTYSAALSPTVTKLFIIIYYAHVMPTPREETVRRVWLRRCTHKGVTCRCHVGLRAMGLRRCFNSTQLKRRVPKLYTGWCTCKISIHTLC